MVIARLVDRLAPLTVLAPGPSVVPLAVLSPISSVAPLAVSNRLRPYLWLLLLFCQAMSESALFPTMNQHFLLLFSLLLLSLVFVVKVGVREVRGRLLSSH